MTRVLITGATSGLGLELAKGFQAKGANLFLLGRKALEELPPKLFNEQSYCQVDLTEIAAMDKVTAFLAARDVTSLDVVIHSAGLGYYGDLKTQPTDSIKELLQVNLYAPLALSQGLLGHLKASYGRLVFISSIAANLPTPDYAVYSASKAALDGLARNIASECHDCIHVQVIHPGATRTDMHRKSGVPEGQFDLSRFAAPAEVAGEIMQAIAEDRFDVTIGRTNRLIRFFGRYFGGVLETVMRWRIRARARTNEKQLAANPGSADSMLNEARASEDTSAEGAAQAAQAADAPDEANPTAKLASKELASVPSLSEQATPQQASLETPSPEISSSETSLSETTSARKTSTGKTSSKKTSTGKTSSKKTSTTKTSAEKTSSKTPASEESSL
ncbi:MAG: SDR family NAD(P)-dependent oxidoreductase [Deinococcota bacterium]